MHLNQRKELFSRAYVHAVTAVAGYSTYAPSVDDDSIDLGVAEAGGSGTLKSPRLELQLKCTSGDDGEGATLAFPLKRKNYDDLRSDVLVPRILVVVAVPGDDISDWLQHSDEQMVLKRCGWWVSLLGQPPSDNEVSVTVHLPRANAFSPDALRAMMGRVADRRLL